VSPGGGRAALSDFVLRHLGERCYLLLDAQGVITSSVAGGPWESDPAALIGRPLDILYPPAERRAGVAKSHLEEAAAAGRFEIEASRLGADGRTLPAACLIEATTDERGVLTGYACCFADMTDRGRIRDSAHARERDRSALTGITARHDRLNAILEGLPQALFVIDRQWRAVHVNGQAARLLRTTADELLGRDIRRELGSSSSESLVRQLERALTERVPVEFDEHYPLLGTSFEVQAFPTQGGISVFFRDVTERRRQQETLRELALYDTLTGLPNRTLFEDRLAQAVAAARRSGQQLGLVLVELDRLDEITDAHGQAAADILVKGTAERLESIVRRSDTLGRFGANRFALIHGNLTRPDGAGVLAEKVIGAAASVGGTASLRDYGIELRASAGIALYPDDGAVAEELIRIAEVALRHARGTEPGSYHFASAALHREVAARKQLERELRAGFTEEQFRMFYLPEIDVATGDVTGIEALLRWNHPDRGIMSAHEFLPVMTHTPLALPVGEWALREACLQAKAWAEAGTPELRVSMNLTAPQLRSSGLVATVQRVLDETGIAPRLLEIEITESQLRDHADVAQRACRELRALGVRISLDDFGSGFSPFAILPELPVDKIKLDRSVIRGVGSGRAAADAGVRAMIDVAHANGLEVVAEGVETEAQLDFLRTSGCDRAQGYHLVRPAAAGDLTQSLLVH
jgi:diguanylate cyclase (GGDEF)-like protein/PAS domain S-box-containing protein